MKASSCLALGLVVLLAGTARAQDIAPVISELQIDNARVTSVAAGSTIGLATPEQGR